MEFQSFVLFSVIVMLLVNCINAFAGVSSLFSLAQPVSSKSLGGSNIFLTFSTGSAGTPGQQYKVELLGYSGGAGCSGTPVSDLTYTGPASVAANHYNKKYFVTASNMGINYGNCFSYTSFQAIEVNFPSNHSNCEQVSNTTCQPVATLALSALTAQ